MAQLLDGKWIVSPQDVIAEFECAHKVALTGAIQSGALPTVETSDAALELLRAQGLAHEKARLESLPSAWAIAKMDAPERSLGGYQAAWEATRQAMDAEADVVYQATLFTGDFVGIADFLVLARNENGDVLRDRAGRAIYDPVDTKSSRAAKKGASLQVGAYAEALVRLERPHPRQVHVWLAHDNNWSAPAAPFIAVARHFREQVASRQSSLGRVPSPLWAPKREACQRCTFAQLCDTGRHEDRDLSMVQEMQAGTRQRLIDAGVTTIDTLAIARDDQRPSRVARDTFERLRAQAALQLAGESSGTIEFELVDREALAQLPDPSPGDLWFDMEGDPYAPGIDGLEYMFGFGYLDNGTFTFDTTEATDAATEKSAFEDFVDIVMARWQQYPDMHVYHYANYEQRALRRLAQQHGTREWQVDQILRSGILVDLYSIVRKSLRFSTESLSIKYIEAVYGVTHADEDVSTAMDSVIWFERSVALRAAGHIAEADDLLAQIRDYNKLDCDSTMQLNAWLLDQKSAAGIATAPRSVSIDAAPEQGTSSDSGEVDLIRALEEGLAPDPSEWTATERARALLAAALQFHTREWRPAWWHFFDLVDSDIDELRAASDVFTIDQAQTDGWGVPPGARTIQREISVTSDSVLPNTILDEGKGVFLLYDPAPEGVTRSAGTPRGYQKATVRSVTPDHALLREAQGNGETTWDDIPLAVLPGAPVSSAIIQQSLERLARSTLPTAPTEPWAFPDTVWADLLLSRSPRLGGSSLPRTGDTVDDVCSALINSADSYVAVQGPPGTGKTYVGSRTVARLVADGWRVGVVAQSHAVVENFLAAIDSHDATLPMAKKPAGKKTARWHETKVAEWADKQAAGYVIGGTAWTFSGAAVQDLGLDLLVIDEAGQFALANAIACAPAARTVLLLGDPQQLPQVTQAKHPEAIDQSVLGHIMGEHATISDDRGYFLGTTYRMHPDLATHVSHLQYEDRLTSAPITELRRLDGVPPGLHPIPVAHTDNTTASDEEAQRVVTLVQSLVGKPWTGASGETVLPARPLEPRDIIVVAAYNAQVRLIKGALTNAGYNEIAVGTVDKFQGREEAIAILSMATSSAEDLPRGIEFLLSPNRLNVGISRAQWACFVVHSPALLDASPSSVDGMQRLGSFMELVAPSE